MGFSEDKFTLYTVRVQSFCRRTGWGETERLDFPPFETWKEALKLADQMRKNRDLHEGWFTEVTIIKSWNPKYPNSFLGIKGE